MGSRSRTLLTLLAALVLLIGCGPRQPQNAAEFVAYMEDARNGFCRQVQIGSTRYTIQCAPPLYMAAKQAGDGGEVAPSLQQRAAALAGHLYFLIRLESVPGAPAPTPEARVLYYTDAAQADLFLKSGAETRSPVVYHFEDNQGLTAYNTIVAGFELPPTAAGSVQFVFHDQASGNQFIQTSFDLSALPAFTASRS